MTMIERVARAINTYAVMYSHATGADLRTYCKEWTVYELAKAAERGVPEEAIVSVHTDKQSAYRKCSSLNARAAISAMRIELETWAYKNYDEGGGVVAAAIDAALNEEH